MGPPGARHAGEAPELGGSGLALEPQSLAARPDLLTTQRRRRGDRTVCRVERNLPLRGEGVEVERRPDEAEPRPCLARVDRAVAAVISSSPARKARRDEAERHPARR